MAQLLQWRVPVPFMDNQSTQGSQGLDNQCVFYSYHIMTEYQILFYPNLLAFLAGWQKFCIICFYFLEFWVFVMEVHTTPWFLWFGIYILLGIGKVGLTK